METTTAALARATPANAIPAAAPVSAFVLSDAVDVAAMFEVFFAAVPPLDVSLLDVFEVPASDESVFESASDDETLLSDVLSVSELSSDVSSSAELFSSD